MTAIHDFTGIEIEHLLGAQTQTPMVKLRALANGIVLIGQVSPDDARTIASNLVTAAARAEYELDLFTGAQAAGMDPTLAAGLLDLVRQGEIARHRNPIGGIG